MWSARRLSITTTTTFMGAAAPAPAPRAATSVRPAAPAPPARRSSRRDTSADMPGLPALRDVDRADRVFFGQLCKHLAHDVVDIALVVPEVVEEGLQRGVGDLQLGRSEIEPVGDLVRPDEVQLVVGHGCRTAYKVGFERGQDLGAHRIARQL